MESTARLPRIHMPNTIHHVMIRGNNRQRIFYGDKYFERFFEILKQSTEKFDHKILACCLMGNHAHLVIHIHEIPLSSVMQNINYRYARWVNRKLKRIGHLFQGRYRSINVNDEIYLINLCRYIHLNPVAAEIVKDVNHYRWSSHQYYISCDPPPWMDISLVTSAIQNKVMLSYADFISRPIEREKWKPGLYISENGEIVINEDVVRQLSQDATAIYSSPLASEKFLSSDLVSSIVCKNLNVDYSALYGTSKNHKVSKQRILLAYNLMQYSNLKMSDIEKLFQRTKGTLSRQLVQLTANPEHYFPPELLHKIECDLNTVGIIQ